MKTEMSDHESAVLLIKIHRAAAPVGIIIALAISIGEIRDAQYMERSCNWASISGIMFLTLFNACLYFWLPPFRYIAKKL